MHARRKIGIIGVIATSAVMASAGAVLGPAVASPSLTGAVSRCPFVCIGGGPVQGYALTPDGSGRISWVSSWTQPSTSTGTVTTPIESLEVHATSGATANGVYTGSGYIVVQFTDYATNTLDDNEVSSAPVTITIAGGAVRVSAVSGFEMIGANAASRFTGVAVRFRTG
jgi:hypothetical protein